MRSKPLRQGWQCGTMSPMSDVAMKQPTGLWVPKVTVLLSHVAVSAALLLVSWANLEGGDPSSSEVVSGVCAALVSGLNLGVASCRYQQRRMVERHMAADHPGVFAPSSPRG